MHTFSEQESLAVILEMLHKSRKNTKDSAIYHLIWGWVILISVIIEYILIQIDYEWHFAIWILSSIVGVGASIRAGRQQKKINQTTTHFDKAMVSVWSGFGMLMAILIMGGLTMGLSWGEIYVGMIALVGSTTFVSGKILEFAPIQYGGLASFALSFLTLFLGWYQHFPTMLLCIGLAMIFSNLIPGYILKRKIS